MVLKEKVRELNRNVRRKWGVGLSVAAERPSLNFVKKKFGGKQLVGVEIGTLEGENAEYILKNLNIKKLYLIDPWLDYEEYGSYSDGGQRKNLNKFYLKTLKRIRKFKDKTVLIRKFSSDALGDVKDRLDFVYIDGNHDYKFVKEDMQNYYKKLKKGGVLAGHDIPRADVSKAFCEFVAEIKNSQPYMEHRDWWLVKEED